MCPSKRPAAKDTPRWDRAAIDDDILGIKFRAEQATLVARAHELDSAERSFQRLHVLNYILRESAGNIFLIPWRGPRKLMNEVWIAKDELRDTIRRVRQARLVPFLASYCTTSP